MTLDPLLFFVRIDFFIDTVFHVLNRVHNVFSGVRRALFVLMAMPFGGFMSSIFGVAPRFFRGTFYLIGYTLVCQTLITNRLTDFFFDATRYLIDLAANLVLVHWVYSWNTTYFVRV